MKPHLERVGAGRLTQRQTVLQRIADHVARREFVDGNGGGLLGLHLAVQRAQHREVVGDDLLEIAKLVLRLDAPPCQPIEATLRGPLVLGELDDGLEVEAIARLVGRLGIPEHQTARQVRVVRDGEHVAALAGFDALLAQQLPELREVVGAGLVGGDRPRHDVLVPEDHVPVHVERVRRISELVTHERGELALRRAVVGGFGGPLDAGPGLVAGFRAVGQRARGRPARLLTHRAETGPPARGQQLRVVVVGPGHDAVRPPVAELERIHRAHADLPQILRVIGERGEIEGPLDACGDGLLAVLVGQRDGLALRIAIGRRRIVALARECRSRTSSSSERADRRTWGAEAHRNAHTPRVLRFSRTGDRRHVRPPTR